MEREDRSTEPDFLPPEPAGPEPELRPGEGGQEPPQQQTWQQPPPQQGWQQQGWQGQAQQPPPPGYGYSPPPPQQPGWQPPPPGYGYGPPPYGYYAQQPSEPDNGAAIGGFVTSLVAGGLLLLTGGLSGPISLIAAPFGIVYSRKGKRAVDEGKTPRHRGLAQAGFVIGIVTVILSVLAIAAWVGLIVLAANDDDFNREFDNDGEFDSTRLRAVLSVVRFAAALAG